MSNYEHFVDIDGSATAGSKLLSVIGPVLVGLGLAVLGATPIAAGLSTIAAGVVAVTVARILDRRAKAQSHDAAAHHTVLDVVSWAVAVLALLTGIVIQAGGEFVVIAAVASTVLTVDSAVLAQKTESASQRLRATIQVALFAAATVYAILGG